MLISNVLLCTFHLKLQFKYVNNGGINKEQISNLIYRCILGGIWTAAWHVPSSIKQKPCVRQKSPFDFLEMAFLGCQWDLANYRQQRKTWKEFTTLQVLPASWLKLSQISCRILHSLWWKKLIISLTTFMISDSLQGLSYPPTLGFKLYMLLPLSKYKSDVSVAIGKEMT